MVRTPAALLVVFSGLGLEAWGPGETTRLAQQNLSVPSTNRLVETAIEYVRSYQNAFRFLVADETSLQTVVSPAGPGGEPSERRSIRGEMFITYLERERQWTAVHDVADVDGLAIVGREDLPSLLRQGLFASVARRVFDWNARYNIGRVHRNFNDPMLALLPFSRERRSRFSFSRGAVDRSEPGVLLVTLGFQERERPTLVRDVNGRSVFARGEVVIEAATGIVRKMTVSFKVDEIDAGLATDFGWEEKLRLWVPSVFAERYAAKRAGRVDVTTCESRYTNYRRFAVTGRLVP